MNNPSRSQRFAYTLFLYAHLDTENWIDNICSVHWMHFMQWTSNNVFSFIFLLDFIHFFVSVLRGPKNAFNFRNELCSGYPANFEAISNNLLQSVAIEFALPFNFLFSKCGVQYVFTTLIGFLGLVFFSLKAFFAYYRVWANVFKLNETLPAGFCRHSIRLLHNFTAIY